MYKRQGLGNGRPDPCPATPKFQLSHFEQGPQTNCAAKLPAVYPISNGFRYYPLHVATEPQLKLKLNNISIVALLDSGAQLSVLPYDFLHRLQIPNLDKVPKRTVRVFGGTPLTLQGSVVLTVTIEDIKQLHPFYYVRADVPFILGYDFM